jgi:hypothetical protein
VYIAFQQVYKQYNVKEYTDLQQIYSISNEIAELKIVGGANWVRAMSI